MYRATLSIALVATAAAVVSARPTYPALMPNGANVKSYLALGHINPDGGGANNDYGLDFASAGHSWTKEFCEKDSDGDGQTNGQELGDPCCEWVKESNAVVQWTDGVSHPGNATLKSDPSLWASISCSSSNATTSSSGSSDVEAGSASAASPSTDATSSAAGSKTTSSSSSGASTVAPVLYSAAGAFVTVAAFFL